MKPNFRNLFMKELTRGRVVPWHAHHPLEPTSLQVRAFRALKAPHRYRAIEAMRCTSVRRLLIVSSALLDSNIGWLPRFLGRTFLRHHVHDQRTMEKQVMESGLD